MGIEETAGTYLDYVFAAVDNPSLRPGATIRLQIVTERLRDEDERHGGRLIRLNHFMRLFRTELMARRAVV